TPYLYTGTAAPNTSMDAAVATAAHDTLEALFPQQTIFFNSHWAKSLVGIPQAARDNGVALGHNVASVILAAGQGACSAVAVPSRPGTDPGDWRPDPLHPNQQALTPGWGQVTPFVIPSGDQFLAPPPPALGSQEYTDAYNEVMSLGGDGIHT